MTARDVNRIHAEFWSRVTYDKEAHPRVNSEPIVLRLIDLDLATYKRRVQDVEC
jgi:hypothetical protein